MDFEQILKLIDHVSDSKLTSFQYESEGLKMTLECGQQQTVIVNQAAASVPEVTASVMPQPETYVQTAVEKITEPSGNIVKSPLVGTFYAAPAEDAAPFVKTGDTVKKGQVLAIVEAMKLMNEIESEFDGEVAEIYVKNGEAVEYGQPLFRIV